MKKYNGWKYLARLKMNYLVKLDLDKLEKKILMIKSISESSGKSVGRNAKIKGFDFGKRKEGFNLSADFKDVYGNKHKLEIFDISINGRFSNYIRKIVGCRIGISVSMIKVDRYRLIDRFGKYWEIPKLREPVNK